MPDILTFPFLLTFIGIPAAIFAGIYYKTRADFKRMDRLMVSMKMGLDYIRQLRQHDQRSSYPKLYKKVNQERKELEGLIGKYSNKLDAQRYQEALKLIHTASALKPQGNFLTEVAGGVLDLVDDFFPEVEKVTSMLRPKENMNDAFIYDAQTDDSTMQNVRHIQQQAPEILEVYSKIEKNRQQIVLKLEESTLSNKAELLAIHQGNMRNYEEVLQGYLKIKEDPTQYYKSEQRLQQARLSLDRVDHSLSDTLRQINENDMMNFEISLRLLQKEG